MPLDLVPALDRTDLLAPPVAAALASWPRTGEVLVAPIDPELADTAAFCAAYDVRLLERSIELRRRKEDPQ